MSEHTQGKLAARPVNYPMGDTGDYDGSYLVTADSGARVIEVFDCNGSGDSDTDEQNIRRLVAAWNACQGTPTEVLEAQQSGGLPWSVADQIEARVVHGVLLDALRLAIGPLAAMPGCAAEYDAVDAAIARATGGKT